MALYGTYRPRTFADVIGQDHVVQTLEQAVLQDKLAHAYLFAGQRGTGKTSVARILAKSLLTRGIADEKLAGQIMAGVDDGSLVDCTEIDAASNRGIDDIRSLLEKIAFAPVISGAKVYIIDEVHMLTREAFNALLKTLEEPPPYAYFILATTELFKIPATIQSRCQRFLFRQIREEEIIRRLQFVADQEHMEIERAALRIIAHGVQGSMRDALSLLDQLRSLPKITVQDVKERIGETGYEYAEQLLLALDEHADTRILDIVRTMEENAVPMEAVMRLLLGNARDRLHAAAQEGSSLVAHRRLLEILLETLPAIRSSPLPALAVESALLRLCAGEAPAAEQHPIAAAKPAPPPKQQEPRAPTVAPPQPAPPVATAKPPPAPAVTLEAPELTLDAVRTAWNGIVLLVNPPSVRMSLKNARVSALTGNVLSLVFSSAFHRDKVKATEASRGVETILANIFKTPMRLDCTLDAAPAAPTQDDVVNMADAAAEIF